MAVKFTNNAATTLAAGINSSVTSIAVTDGSVFPTITGSDHFYVTFDDTTNKEIVKVTARSGNTLTVVRGHDNTTARAFSSGDKAELRIVAALLDDVKTDVSSTLTVDTFTGNGSTTAFTLSVAPASEDNLIVFIEGVYQNPGDFTLSGTTLTLDVAPANSRKIIVYHVAALVSGNNLTHNQFTCNGSTTAFTLGLSPIHENNTQVFLDGVYQQKTDYAVSGTTLTMDTAPASGAILEVMTFTQTEVNTLPASFVSGLTQVTAVGADHFMIFDATDSALKKSLVSDVLESATSISTSADATAITIDSNEKVTFTSDVTTGGHLSVGGNNNELRFYEGANYVGFEAPALSADKIWVLPAADGSSGQVLQTNGSGTLSFTTVSGTTINNNADNRIITGSGTSNTLEGESGLTYNGSTLAVTGAITSDSTVTSLTNFNSTSGNDLRLNAGSANRDIFMQVNGTTHMTVQGSTGNVGIGTTSPAATLDAKRNTNTVNNLDSLGFDVAALIGNAGSNPGNHYSSGLRIYQGSGTVGSGLGVMHLGADNGTAASANTYTAQIIAPSGMTGGIKLSAADSAGAIKFNTGGYNERMRITSTGSVGINETSPDFSGFGSNGGGLELDDVGSSFTAVKVSQGSTGNVYLAASTGAGYLWQHSNSPLIIGVNNAEAIRIAENGELMVGTSNLFGGGNKTTAFFGAKSDCTLRLLSANNSGFTNLAIHNTGLNTVGSISQNGSNASFNTSSDYRLKENVDYTWDATTRFKQLKPARFNWIRDETNTLQDGFLAHEVEDIVPEAVKGTKDEAKDTISNVVLNASSVKIDEDITEQEWIAGKEDGTYESDTTWVASYDEPMYQQIDHSKLVPLLVKTIQELEARITTLENA